MRIVTLASPGTLAAARALSRSLSVHQPHSSHEILLIADVRVARELARDSDRSSEQIRSVEEELELDLEALLSLHGEHELSVLLLPGLLRSYAKRTAEPVVHLPASAWVLDALTPIQEALAQRSVMLVKRAHVDLPNDGLEPSNKQLHAAGRIEQTILGVDGSQDCLPFLDWWHAHVQNTFGSLDARRSGERPEDRPWLARYLELAPARFRTAVLHDPGSALNMWNLDRHLLAEGPNGGVLVDGRTPLRFVDLPGFDPDRPYRLSAGASRARVSRSPALHQLCERYAAELRHCGWRDPYHHAQVGRRLADGLIYDESLRAAYATALALGQPVADLFSPDGTRAFIAWLEGPAPRGAAFGINRYLFHRVARERPDVVRSYPDLDGADGQGYRDWCWAFGRNELAIPERFLPPRQGVAASFAAPVVQVAPHEPADGGAPAVAPRPADPAAPAAEEPAAATAKPARDGPAVRLTGYLGHTLGLGAAARGYAQALDAAGVPVSTVSVPLHHLELPVELAAEYGRQGFQSRVHSGAHGFEIVAVNADELPDLVQRLGEDYFEGPRIGIWGWETNTIPPRWQRAFALVQEVWVYSRFMAQNIGAVSPVPVIALPPPVHRPTLPAEPLRMGVPDGFLFLFVFDYLSTVQRKNPVGLIEAFTKAFQPGEGPQLLIKTINGPLRPLAEEELLWAAHGRPDIHIVDRSLSGEELGGLMAACDCYVSLHRAEGFGLTMAEAMSIGKPVIATGYSGNLDFMNEHNSYLVEHTITRVGPECEIYPPEGEWAQPSVEHAAELMRRVYSDPEHAAKIGAQAAEDIAAKLSPKATGAAMRARLEQLSRR